MNYTFLDPRVAASKQKAKQYLNEPSHWAFCYGLHLSFQARMTQKKKKRLKILYMKKDFRFMFDDVKPCMIYWSSSIF